MLLSHERTAESAASKVCAGRGDKLNKSSRSKQRPVIDAASFSTRHNCRAGCCHGTSRGRAAEGWDVFIYRVQ